MKMETGAGMESKNKQFLLILGVGAYDYKTICINYRVPHDFTWRDTNKQKLIMLHACPLSGCPLIDDYGNAVCRALAAVSVLYDYGSGAHSCRTKTLNFYPC